MVNPVSFPFLFFSMLEQVKIVDESFKLKEDGVVIFASEDHPVRFFKGTRIPGQI